MRRIFLPAALVSAATLALAGCSQAGSQSGTEEAETGPLDEYLAFLWEGEEWTEERYEAENLEREELIAECMKKEGFEYTPNPDSGGWVAADDVGTSRNGAAWSSRKRTATASSTGPVRMRFSKSPPTTWTATRITWNP